MGKRRIDKIQKIEAMSERKVRYCKRKKGLLKKAIELSVLCDVQMFLFIYDKSAQRVVHYCSDDQLNIMDVFNQGLQREFYSNDDYLRVGG